MPINSGFYHTQGERCGAVRCGAVRWGQLREERPRQRVVWGLTLKGYTIGVFFEILSRQKTGGEVRNPVSHRKHLTHVFVNSAAHTRRPRPQSSAHHDLLSAGNTCTVLGNIIAHHERTIWEREGEGHYKQASRGGGGMKASLRSRRRGGRGFTAVRDPPSPLCTAFYDATKPSSG